ncbi:MAG: universal stress protein [Kofleriaceae bacterium]|nr:universal stress protein [Kofleriaceae bacterium]
MQRDHYRIVIALDLSEYAEIVLEYALDQAVRHDSPDLHFVHVLERGDGRELVRAAELALARLTLQGLETFGQRGDNWRARLHVRAGKAHEEIVALANEIDANLIVVGRFGSHRRLGTLGSTAHRVLENAPCATLAVTLVDREVEAPQCPECVRVRAETDGEAWFCPLHSAPDRVTLATTFLPTSSWTGGGTMW